MTRNFGISKAAIALALFASATVATSPAFAQSAVPSPRLKPAAPNLSSILNDRESKQFTRAVRAARKGDWATVKAAQASLTNLSAKDTLRWLRASRDRNAPLSELTYVAHNLANWPRMNTIKSKAERKILTSPNAVSDVGDWFRGQDPISGEGRLALAQYYFDRGETAQGQKWLKLAWREAKLTRDLQRSTYKAYGKYLGPDDHAARGDYLVWLGRAHYPSVRGLLSLMPKRDRRLLTARMALRTNAKGMNARVEAIPSADRGDPGFGYERGYWRRKRRSKDYALSVYQNIDSAPQTDRGKSRLWRERNIMTYWLIKEARYTDAYLMTQNHGMTRGADFAHAEFLAGWLALTKLDQPEAALRHFTTLRDGVGLPVSLSRASYWQGRAAEILSNAQAQSYYADAAQYPNTFYGQLAADRMSDQISQIVLPSEPVRDFARAEFESDPRVKAARLFAEAGSELFFTQMSFFLDDTLSDATQLSLLSELGRDFGYIRPSVRAAKQAGRFGTMLTESGYPLVPAIDALPNKFEKAFVYGIARQESEFNYSAVSHANAYGLMQMINATARSTARRHRIPYSRARMTSDIDYSARLGAHHLNDLLKQFDGSYIMTAAAYNAGASRVKRWVKDYGDPRTGEIDPVDWLESLPYSETRNYIQRVMENMQVYRARMNGGSHPNYIDRDLRIGQRPS